MDQSQADRSRVVLESLVVLVILLAQYFIAGSWVRRFEPILFFAVSWPLTIGTTFLLRRILRTTALAIGVGALVGLVVSLVVFFGLDAVLTTDASLRNVGFLKRDPLNASVMFVGFSFLLGGWLVGASFGYVLRVRKRTR